MMMLIEANKRRRGGMHDHTNSTFVPREEFCRLLLSTRRLVRCDEPDINVRGLLDTETGDRFLIEQEKLFGK